eukprot:CAMPEP_0172555240 /NCGR_PEP_ID=MMETSP1067-20121228/58316_1 /TAXON_ID=265564 ORGANISM="Thalassiosira punctigera, Strain Tpunct2005C2" /NCGR_SAMPLE_ID=MMETSP1067 /ASSEMBLY_ACC=CAM_ASM_000444 /LENGTH=388 /DNA_ID=CAMNT_0013343755 /DNA_START=78 /DNA_END=1245 /DNA_ORIENTATION=-
MAPFAFDIARRCECPRSASPMLPDEITPYATISVSSSHSLFGVRGGAFFGFGRSSKLEGDGDGDGGDGKNPKRYPPMSQVEIEEKLNIPIFGLTDAEGNGVILSDNGNNIFHFFFSKHMADAALKQVTAANVGAPGLKVTAFHLGKCWFKLIGKSGSVEFKLQKYGKDIGMGGTETKPVHFRLVPNMKDLIGARILTGLKPGDVERLKDAVEEPDPPKALSIIQNAANSDTSSFNSPFDEIPVFAISQMRVRKRDERGNATGQAMLPMHLSTKTMGETWNEFVHASPQFEDAEATLQLIELHKMIDLMQRESDFDFRNVVFVVPSYDKDERNNDPDDSDEEDSDDDSGGGGDNGMKADFDEGSIEPFVEPFVSMEMFADAPGQTLVQI